MIRLSAKAIFRPRSDVGRFVETHITPAVTASVEASCKLIEQSAQGYAPVDTGALRDSITTEIDDSGKTVIGRVGPHVDYAEYVEFGTGRLGNPEAPYPHVESWPGMVAQPYMRPAFEENKDAVKDLFRSQISAALEGA